MRKIGLHEIEDIALGAALLGAGGGGDPYIGKLVAMSAIRECGPVTLLSPEEVPDDALIVPIAMMGAPTILSEKGIGGKEYQVLYDTVSQFYGKPVYAFMPIEAGGVNSMLPIADVYKRQIIFHPVTLLLHQFLYLCGRFRIKGFHHLQISVLFLFLVKQVRDWISHVKWHWLLIEHLIGSYPLFSLYDMPYRPLL